MTRDLILHDGRDLRRFSIAGRTQAFLACVATLTVAFSAYGVSQATADAIAVSGISAARSPEEQMADMRQQVMRMQADIAAAKEAARIHAARVEARQRLISAVLSGKGDADELSRPLPDAPETSAMTDEVLAPLRRIETRQRAFAQRAIAAGEARFEQTANHLRRLGLNPDRFVDVEAMGGPYEPATDDPEGTEADADAQFRSLFMTWKKLDTLEQTVISVPSLRPVDHVRLTSGYGVRSDPFRGTRAMHAGIDIPGPVGTKVYATADGIISRAGRAGGYGNLVEINHGRGIETRYGHLSQILVKDNQQVHRGDLIGLMGSTGRSTGSHLHYEVRVDGRAVNPVPFLHTGEYLTDLQARGRENAVGGPAEAE
ncbi:M23 family metallopeptidase [Stakelama tenebrarum]|nr:M23 family metallopeptidase [Sphingosinithalassobacter tenebrarum]